MLKSGQKKVVSISTDRITCKGNEQPPRSDEPGRLFFYSFLTYHIHRTQIILQPGYKPAIPKLIRTMIPDTKGKLRVTNC